VTLAGSGAVYDAAVLARTLLSGRSNGS
jgi:hypothetical protein